MTTVTFGIPRPQEHSASVTSSAGDTVEEMQLAVIATLHQPVRSMMPDRDLGAPTCGECTGSRWPCSTALLLGEWPQGGAHTSAPTVVIPNRNRAAEIRLAAIAALHQPVSNPGPLGALTGPVCPQCARSPCATERIAQHWPDRAPSSATECGHPRPIPAS